MPARASGKTGTIAASGAPRLQLLNASTTVLLWYFAVLQVVLLRASWTSQGAGEAVDGPHPTQYNAFGDDVFPRCR